MGAKKKIMLPIDSASLKTYKITIYLYFSDDYTQKIWQFIYIKFDVIQKSLFHIK